jgi:hypothetical protein
VFIIPLSTYRTSVREAPTFSHPLSQCKLMRAGSRHRVKLDHRELDGVGDLEGDLEPGELGLCEAVQIEAV